MVQKTSNELPNPTITSIATDNGDQELDRLRMECERLRRSLAEVQAERDDFRHLFYASLRATVTEQEKAETEQWARALIEHGGRPISELRDLIEELR